MELTAALVLVGLMVLLLAGGLWIGLALMAIGILGMLGFTTRAPGDGMAVAIWSHGSSWTLTALPLRAEDSSILGDCTRYMSARFLRDSSARAVGIYNNLRGK